MPTVFCDLNFIVTAHQGPDPEQRQAMKLLEEALVHMEARGFGSDDIKFVLDRKFLGFAMKWLVAGLTLIGIETPTLII